LLTTAKTFRSSLLAGVFPRLCQTGFTYAQPFLISTLINHLDAPEKSSNVGYALIGAYVLVFLGAAVSSGRSSHETLRAAAKIRGALITTIYSKTQKIQLSSAVGSSASTLMTADVERIAASVKVVHSLWDAPLELIIAIVLLERQIGAACVAPIVLALGNSLPILYADSRTKLFSF
jgi:ATP-binding cassette subfamily C (CFTR/MRP) protein 1